jgi:uncharacterized protein involved in outer membrane biogenesis
MKKALKIIGIIVGLLLIAIVTIPLVVNVDKFRPQIVKLANEKMNGTLELGKLSLSLWGRVHVGIDGLAIKDLQQKSVVSVKDASIDVPFMSLISGAPLVTFNMKQPDVNVIKGKDGKMNVMTLMKEQPSASAAQGDSKSDEKKSADQKVDLPSMVVNAHLGIFIENAKVVYKDEVSGLANTVDNLNFRVKDFSLTRKTDMELWADLKTQMDDLRIEGPLKLIAELTPEVNGGEFKSAALKATFTADDLEIQKGSLFHKQKGIPANFKFDGAMSQVSLKLNHAAAKFHNAEIVVSGDYDKEIGANIHFEAKPIELKPWSELVPMLKEYELEGKIGLVGDVKGKPETLTYSAKMTIQNLAMKGPNLKAKPMINGEILILTDKIEKFFIDVKGPGNDITLDAKVNSFTKPNVTFALKSTGMDLDQWIDFPKTDAKKEAKAVPATSKDAKGIASKPAAEADYDALIEPLRKNEIAKATVVDGTVSIAFMKAMNVRIDDIAAKVQMKNLVVALTALRMKMYDGTLAGAFTTDLKPKQPQYTMNLNVNGIDMQKAVEAQFASMKNTIVGKLSMNAQGGGASFNTIEIKKLLQLKGDFKILNAQFKSMDIAKMANEAISGSIAKIANKVPLLQGKKLEVSSNADSKYDMVSSSFTINNGMLDAPNFVAKASEKRGIDIKGSTKMGLIDESLDAKWELIDTQHMTGAHAISVQVGGKTVNNVLAKGDKEPVVIPISVGCKWSAPCVNYAGVPEYLAGIAAGRLGKASVDVVKEKAQDEVKKAIGNGLKGLFGH